MNPERWQEVKKVLAGALERPPEQQHVYLDQACTDPELRREVESLIDAHNQGQTSFLEQTPVTSSSLQKGAQLGQYIILAPIGSGGMGEVYRAHDTKLKRDVAIKVLPLTFVNDPERLARFQREARLLASLNHLNIATIHGLEDSGNVHALVMELVEGPTLADRIRRGPIPIEEALPIAKQMAEALEYAHEHSIIHRDLKPANVKVSNDETVKILDFGLAKAMETNASADLVNSPTISQMATEAGVLLGTVAYMSPEQAKARLVDRRADIWAFGCVLYEMLTGQRAFQGETVTDTLAAIMRAEPDWLQLPAATPTRVRVLLQRCLRKDPKQRLRDIGDARISLDEVLSGALEVAAMPLVIASAWRRALPWAIGFLAGSLVMGAAVWILKPAPSPPPRPVSRVSIDLPPGEQLAGLNQSAVAISPDGSRLVYVATQDGTQQLYLRDMDSLEARPIPGTEGASGPFFSPDGRWVGFFAGSPTGGQLKKIAINGGAAITLCDAPYAVGASWSKQGAIVFGTLGPLMQVSDAGGTPEALTHLGKGEGFHVWPEFLPNGRAVLFTAGPGVAVYSLETGEQRDLIQGANSPHYLPSGYLVYAQPGGDLMALQFDAQRLRVTGTATPVAQGVLIGSGNQVPQYSLSDRGSLVYVSATAGAIQWELVWVDRKGVEQQLPAPPHAYRYPRLSPDGGRVAVTIEERGEQIWLYDLRRDTLTRLTFEGAVNLVGAWTPDGNRIAFSSNREGVQNLFWERPDGGGGLERLAISSYIQTPNSFSPDGQALAFIQIAPKTGEDIGVLRMSNRKAQPFLQTVSTESAPTFSPDGPWLAYVSNESGRNEVYVQPYPGPGEKYQISNAGGTEPVWNPKGGELFYRSGDKMMAVPVQTKGTFSAGKPHVLFEGQYVPTPLTLPDFDVSPDGQRFLMLKAVGQVHASTQINVVLNWAEELKRLVPAGNK